jgi:hypothetical protein
LELSEEEIQRFSRQILLKEVGGAGQAALGRAVVLAMGKGDALETAAIYLAAGGSRVERRMDGGNGMASLASEETAPKVVALGSWDGRPALVFSSGATRAPRFRELQPRLGPPPEGAVSIELGALSALVFQRLVLGLGHPEGGLVLHPEGSWEAFEL